MAMKTTADLPLTEYQRGQLAHYRSLMRLDDRELSQPLLAAESEIGAAAGQPKDSRSSSTKTRTNKEESSASKNPAAKKSNDAAPRVLTFPDARDILITVMQDYKEEEIKSTSKRGSAPLHRMSARKPHVRGSERKRSLLGGSGASKETSPHAKSKPTAKTSLKPAPSSPAPTPQRNKHSVIDLTLFGADPAQEQQRQRHLVAKIPITKIPQATKPVEPQELWMEKEQHGQQHVVPMQLLAMTAYSEARSEVEEKQAQLALLTEKLGESDDPIKLQGLKEKVEKLSPELQRAIQKVQSAEARLKMIASKDY